MIPAACAPRWVNDGVPLASIWVRYRARSACSARRRSRWIRLVSCLPHSSTWRRSTPRRTTTNSGISTSDSASGCGSKALTSAALTGDLPLGGGGTKGRMLTPLASPARTGQPSLLIDARDPTEPPTVQPIQCSAVDVCSTVVTSVCSAVVTSVEDGLGPAGPPGSSTDQLGLGPRRQPGAARPRGANVAPRSVPCSSDCPGMGSEARPGALAPLPCAATATGPRGSPRRSRPARFLPRRSRQVARAPRGRRLRRLGRLLDHKVRRSIGLGPGGAAGHRWLLLLAGPLQQRADVAMHPTQILQQPVAELPHLLGLGIQRCPLLLHVLADLLGRPGCLRHHRLRLAGHVRPDLLGLLLGPLHDHLSAAPGLLHQLLARPARILQHRGRLGAELLERRGCLLPQAGDLALQLDPCPFSLLQTRDEIGR